MEYKVTIGTYSLVTLESIVINKSVETLADTADIVLPATVFNKTLEIEDKIKRGDEITIELGYDGNLMLEFTGYLQAININNGSITLEAEDELFKLRKPLQNKEYNNISLKNLLKTLLKQISDVSLSCSYNIPYEKFTVHNSTLFEVLKVIQNDTGANIYMEGKVLNIHPAESKIGKTVGYDFTINIETDNLKYMREDERPVEVEIIAPMGNGKIKRVKVGTTGGDKIKKRINNVVDEKALKLIAEQQLKQYSFNGYKGSITGWLRPYCEPTYSAVIIDTDYPIRQGKYFVKSVKTSFSQSGGKREVELGVLLTK